MGRTVVGLTVVGLTVVEQDRTIAVPTVSLDETHLRCGSNRLEASAHAGYFR